MEARDISIDQSEVDPGTMSAIRGHEENWSDSQVMLLVSRRSRILPYLCLREFLVRPLIFLGYSLTLLCHFVGWVLFSVYAIYCSVTQLSTTQRCHEDFHLFRYPKELEVFWQVVTGINAIAYIVLIRKLRYADASSFSIRELLKIPKSLLILVVELAIAVSYETMMIVYEEVASARAIEVGFIWRNICVTSLVFLLNFTSRPRKRMYKVHFFSTLLVFFLDQLVMACLMVCHVHYRITALGASIKPGDSVHIIVTELSIIGVFALHSSLLKFFWNKIFESDKFLSGKEIII